MITATPAGQTSAPMMSHRPGDQGFLIPFSGLGRHQAFGSCHFS
jgi:hypothetical protein